MFVNSINKNFILFLFVVALILVILLTFNKESFSSNPKQNDIISENLNKDKQTESVQTEKKIVPPEVKVEVKPTLKVYDYRDYLIKDDKTYQTSCSDTSDYSKCCIEIFKRIRNPDKKLVFKPPLKKIPDDLLKDFTQEGKMYIDKDWYFNDAYSDSDSDNKNVKGILPRSRIEYWLKKLRNNEPLGYEDLNLRNVMFTFSSVFKNKSTTVIGTVEPWIEAMSYELGSTRIITLDYTRKDSEIKEFEWWHLNDYLDDAIENKKLENIDNAVSFSSIEHSGLGRFGDPLSPYGDFEAMQQVHCMLKKGGLLFLSIPVVHNDTGYIRFNAGRYYGSARLKLMFKGWNVLVQYVVGEPIFVLQKI